jgi:hypothetical protein
MKTSHKNFLELKKLIIIELHRESRSLRVAFLFISLLLGLSSDSFINKWQVLSVEWVKAVFAVYEHFEF